ncbi:MAG: sigma factor-like helix-turn-helix DNA-binding protein [Actinomycetes bacterium]
MSPEQRAAFVLHEVFAYSYPEIASIVETSEDNARQLVTRARKCVEGRKPRFEASRARREELTQTFLAAARQGDLAELEGLLARDVVLRGDGGGKAPAPRSAIHGREKVARTLLAWVRRATARSGGDPRSSRSTSTDSRAPRPWTRRWAPRRAGPGHRRRPGPGGELDRQPGQAAAPRPAGETADRA